MNITKGDIFEAGYLDCLCEYEKFKDIPFHLGSLGITPDLPDYIKEKIRQLSEWAKSLDRKDRLSVSLFRFDLCQLLSWFMSLPLDDEVES